MEKVYFGVRWEEGCHVWVFENNRTRRLPRCGHLRNHSPDGFEWGYCGSGPSQLALALCVDVLGDARQALAIYQEFKRLAVACFLEHGWVFTESHLRRMIETLPSNTEREGEGFLTVEGGDAPC